MPIKNLLVPALLIGLACAALPVLAGGLFSATGAVVAMMGDELYVGEAEGHLGGAGTLAIHAQKNPALRCIGQFTSSADLGGSGQLQCSDNTTATFKFTRLSAYRGYGIATFSRGEMSFAYGFAPDEAAPYLTLPAGKRLMHNGTEFALVDR